MLKRFVPFCSAILFFFILAAPCSGEDKIIYTMVNVCDETLQGDSHVLQFGNGLVYVIDAGGGGNEVVQTRLAKSLRRKGIKKIDVFFLTHAHKDHYGGILEVIKAGIRIRSVYITMPQKELCDREIPWGCDYGHYRKTVNILKRYKAELRELKVGDSLQPEEGVELKVLHVSNGEGVTNINDTSMVLKLEFGKSSVLFTADLYQALDSLLKEDPSKLRSVILKVAHHGTEGTTSNLFFNAVAPEVALVPSPKSLWQSPRSKRIRDYFSEKKIPVYVSGIHGDVEIILTPDGYRVNPSRKIRKSLQ